MAISSIKIRPKNNYFFVTLFTVLTVSHAYPAWANNFCADIFKVAATDTSVEGYKKLIENLPGQDVVNPRDITKLYRGVGGSRSNPEQISGLLFGDEKYIMQSSSLRIATQVGLNKGLSYQDAVTAARIEVMASIQNQLKNKSVTDFNMDQSERSYFTLASGQRTADVLFADGETITAAIGYGTMSFSRSAKENPGKEGMVEVLVISPNEVAFLGGVLPSEYLILAEIFPKAIEGVYFGKPKTTEEPYKFSWQYAKISQRNLKGAATEVQVYSVKFGHKMELTELLGTFSSSQDLSNFISGR